MKPSAVDFSDLQGLVRFGYAKMNEASYVHLRVKDSAAARAWLRIARVTSADALTPPPASALQVAFTAAGLAALDIPPAVLAGFAPEFLAGIAYTVKRAEELGIREKLVVVMQSEMGRTPNYNKGNGKDHWSIGSAISRFTASIDSCAIAGIAIARTRKNLIIGAIIQVKCASLSPATTLDSI